MMTPMMARSEAMIAKNIPKSTWIWDVSLLNDIDMEMLEVQHVTKVYVQVDTELPIEEYVLFSERAQQHHIVHGHKRHRKHSIQRNGLRKSNNSINSSRVCILI